MDKKIPSFLKTLFWDHDFEKLDLAVHFDFVAVRVLNKGGEQELRWLLNSFDHASIQDVVYNSANIRPNTKRFWHAFYQQTT